MNPLRLVPLLLITSCAVYDRAAPLVAVKNPLAFTPLCVGSLSDANVAKVERAAWLWSLHAPEAPPIHIDRTCDRVPWVRVAPEFHGLYPEGRGYTLPPGVGLPSEDVSQCIVTHELGHWLGLVLHGSDREPQGAMRDGTRGDCEPSEVDAAVLNRLWTGKVSR